MRIKRLIGVIAVRNGRVVKSVGYRRWFPAGGIGTALTNLDRWGVDEILLVDVSRAGRVDNRVLDLLRSTRIRTPLTLGGGIRSLDDVTEALRSGADRILVESLFWEAPGELDRIIRSVGAQAVVGSLPMVEGHGEHINCWTPSPTADGRPSDVDMWIDRMQQFDFEEVLVTDVRNEGRHGSFSTELPDRLSDHLQALERPIIWFGGLCSTTGGTLLSRPETVGVAFGNLLLEHEVAVPALRDAIRERSPEALRQVRLSRD